MFIDMPLRKMGKVLSAHFTRTQSSRVRSGFVKDILDLGLEVDGDPAVMLESDFAGYGFAPRTVKNGPRYLLNNKTSEKKGLFYAVVRGVATGELANELNVEENTPVIQIAKVASKKEIGLHFLAQE